jgi:hypothetical protein
LRGGRFGDRYATGASVSTIDRGLPCENVRTETDGFGQTTRYDTRAFAQLSGVGERVSKTAASCLESRWFALCVPVAIEGRLVMLAGCESNGEAGRDTRSRSALRCEAERRIVIDVWARLSGPFSVAPRNCVADVCHVVLSRGGRQRCLFAEVPAEANVLSSGLHS